MADDAGALLVRSGLVTSSALEEARAKAENLGGTLGEQLVAAGSVSDDDLTEFYKKRLLVPQVNPNSLARLPAKVVAVIPSNMAIELRAIPVSLDADNNLTIAMSDPSDRRAVDEIATYTGSYVVRAVATQMQIAWCLAHYYGHVTHLGQRLLQQREEAPTPAAPRTRGVTGQVNAMRHRGLVPGEANIASRTTEPEIDAQPDPDAPKPRPRSVSGEIRVPQRRAPSIRPPLPEDSGQIAVPEVPADLDSGPVVTIEEGPIDDDDEPEIEVRADPTPLPVPKRKRPAEPDPPELAARAGEVQLATGTPIKAITFDEPAIIIADDFQDEVNPRPKRITNENTSPLEASVQVSGELSSREEKGRPDDANAPSVFVELGDEESQPIMLHQTRPTDDDATRIAIQAAPPSEIVDEKSDVVVLETRKKPSQPPPNRHRNTVVGIGAVTAATRARSIDSAAPTEELDDIPTAARAAVDNDPTRVDAMAVPARDDDTSDDHVAAPPRPGSARDTSEIAIVPAPSRATPPPSGQVKLDNVRRAPTRHDDDDEEDDASDVAHHDLADKPTMVMSALELDEVIPGRVSQAIPAHLTPKPRGKIDWDPTDEGWGPPGTTIPPPLLGDIPLSDDQSGMIPLPDMDSAPLIVAPPVPPERAVRAQSSSEEGLSRALEAATNRVLELIHTLDHTTTRDQVVAVMIAHLAETHQRAGFFAARGGELSLFAITPRVPTMPWQTLRLDRPSTLQDVVGTRLPYRGPMLDAVSREFLTATLGACPPEILLVPVSVRERVVGVLFGDNRTKHTFDDQLALAARAAGMALERILKAKRGDA
jgi:hypothetical protein